MDTTPQTLGFIGLGIMGAAMAENLAKAGHRLLVWNRTAAKAKPLEAHGALVCDSPADVARRTPMAIFLNVTDTPDVEAVLFGNGGIAATAQPGLIVVDHSTISPVATRGFAERLAKQGVTLLDAPVTGGDVGAKNATLSIMVGGPAEAFERLRPVLACMGKTITHVGDSGAGQTCKACNQIAGMLALQGVCEAMALAKKSGLDVMKMLEVVGAGAASSWQLQNLGPKIAKGDFAPGFMIDLVLKDLGIVADAARQSNLPLPGAALVENLFRAAQAHGEGRSGTQALAKAYEALGGFGFDR